MRRLIVLLLLSVLTIPVFATVTDVTGAGAPATVTVWSVTAAGTASEVIYSPTFDIERAVSVDQIRVTVQIVSASPSIKTNGSMPDLVITPQLASGLPDTISSTDTVFWSGGQFFLDDENNTNPVSQLYHLGYYHLQGDIAAKQLRFRFQFLEVDDSLSPSQRPGIAHQRREYYIYITKLEQ